MSDSCPLKVEEFAPCRISRVGSPGRTAGIARVSAIWTLIGSVLPSGSALRLDECPDGGKRSRVEDVAGLDPAAAASSQPESHLPVQKGGPVAIAVDADGHP